MRFTRLALLICTLFQTTNHTNAETVDEAAIFEWSTLPDLPGPGIGGAFASRIGNRLVIGGGTSFDGTAWDSTKMWSDRILILDPSEENPEWVHSQLVLPDPCAYGVSISLPDGSGLWIGGAGPDGILDQVLHLDSRNGSLRIIRLEPLPFPLAYATGTIIDGVVYLYGGISDPLTAASNVLLSFTPGAPDPEWRELEPLPGGSGRILATAGSHGGSLYIFGGCHLRRSYLDSDDAGDHRRTYSKEAWRYDPQAPPGLHWSPLNPLPRAASACPSPALPTGTSYLALLGGDDGSDVDHIDTLREDHPGFSRDILTYHVLTDEWTSRPGSGEAIPVTVTGVMFGEEFLIAGGEIRPRLRSVNVIGATPLFGVPGFTLLDWSVLALYLLIMLGLGIHFSRGENGTEDFFFGGGRIPWWAAGVSIFATQLSAITFMAIPAKSYATDWTLFIQSLGIFAMAPVVAILFLPFFRRLNVVTAYEYLERRFSLGVRLFGSAQYLLFQFGRMAIVIYLPAIALAAVTGIDVHACILLMGVLCIVYTVLGGIEAVIWSDVLQAVVLLGGAVLVITVCVGGVEGGVGELYDRAVDADKLRIADLDWDFTRASLPVVILGGIFINLIPYASDQSVVQRYLTTKDESSARKAILLGGIVAIPASLLFFGLGTALFGFYDANPERLAPLAKTDQILPWFLVNEIPAGLSGLVVAGIFAAAMSSLDSSMNSSATALINDFHHRLMPARSKAMSPTRELALARLMTIALGVVGTGAALLLASFPAESIFDRWLEIVGLFASGLCGLFVLGIFTRRPGTFAAFTGVLASVSVLLLVKNGTQLNSLLFAGVGVFTCFSVGWLTGLFVPGGNVPSATTFVRDRRS